MTNEIKATAPTLEECWRKIKELTKRLELAESCLLNGGYDRYCEELTIGDHKND